MENQDNNHDEAKKEKGNWKEQLKNEFKKEFKKGFEKEVKKGEKKSIGEEEKPKKEKKVKSPMARRAGYAFAIFFALLFWWLISNFENWGWKFITEDWEQVVDIVKFSIYLNIVAYGMFIFYDKKLFYYAGRLAVDCVGIYVAVRLFQVFPFDFEHLFGGWEWLNSVFPWILIIGIAGAGIAIIIRTAKLTAGKNIYD